MSLEHLSNATFLADITKAFDENRRHHTAQILGLNYGELKALGYATFMKNRQLLGQIPGVSYEKSTTTLKVNIEIAFVMNRP